MRETLAATVAERLRALLCAEHVVGGRGNKKGIIEEIYVHLKYQKFAPSEIKHI
jgi:hypothetical protein